MCLAAAYWARVDRILYAGTRDDAAAAGFDDDFLYRELVLPIPQRTIPTHHHQGLRDSAVEVFTQWLAKPDRVAY